MARHYLFGPVTLDFADQNLHGLRQIGNCLAFDHAGATDLAIGPTDTWESVCARLPTGWQPDFVVLHLPYTTIPACLWSAPVPLVGWAEDWNLLWHGYRRRLRRCDLILVDSLGVETFARQGVGQARAANLFGCKRPFLEAMPDDSRRDVDVLFVGNLHPAVQRERLPWLARLARLGERRRIVIRTGVLGDAYRALLAQARIVFNRSTRGECNLRVFEAAAAGALLFQEADNREVPAYFRDRQECVYYTADNLEALLEYYLDHEDERRAVAEAARARVRQYGFEALWEGVLDLVEREWDGMADRARQRCTGRVRENLVDRCWQLLSSTDTDDPTLVHDLTTALGAQPGTADASAEYPASLHNALGLAGVLVSQGQGRSQAEVALAAVDHFRRAVETQPSHVLAGLNLVEALAGAGQTQTAIEHARRTLSLLDRLPVLDPAGLDGGHFPPIFDLFRVEWERAAWNHAGQPAAEADAKRELLRWRLHALLADLTGDLTHRYEAVVARPDLPSTRIDLGYDLIRAQRFSEAIPHLRRAVADLPFELDVPRALFRALGAIGDVEGQRRLAQDRRLLARAAPQVVPPEEWFAAALPQPPSSGQTTARSVSRIVWEGPQATLHSLALVNRELCRRLIERGHEVALVPADLQESGTPAVPVPPLLAERFRRPLSRPADVHVRHQWPPNFQPPPAGHWVLIQPWEFGSLPRSWVGPVSQEVDEVWAYSRSVRECYLQGGAPADRVHVVPLGVDVGCFRPDAPLLPLRTAKRFKFLFVGGTIYRKGIDLLLEAYTQTFTRADDVCLVIKDMCVGSFYRGQTAGNRIAEVQAQVRAPEVEYIDRPLTENELAGLYTACDCLVHPYRGEGFGLVVAEAMAGGLPVIVTGHGAALDFCNAANAFLLPAQVVRFPEKRVGDLETVDYPWLAEPDLQTLQDFLRYVVAHPAEARVRGQAACVHIRNHFTWEHATDALERRLEELRRRPIRRLAVRSDRIHAVAVRSDRIHAVARRPDESGHYEPVQTVPKAARPRVSLCLIVKNEEAHLPACLGSAADLVDEIIVVDTGSTDRTKDVAARLGAGGTGVPPVKIFDFAWVDSFAAARNESLRHATGDWIFWLDADDRLDEENRQRLRALFGSLRDENVAYVMKCLCLPDAQTGTATLVDHVRLFRNHPDIRWRYRVHEQILPALRQLGGTVRWTDVVIQHSGYQDPSLRGRKLERDLRLLQLEAAEQPDDPFTLFNLGQVYNELGRTAEALPLLRRSLDRSHPSDSIVRKLYALIMQCHRQLGQPAEALAFCQAGRTYYPDDVELLFLDGLLRRELGDRAGAEACLVRLLQTPPGNHFASVDTGLHGYKTRHNLALLYLEQGRTAEAEVQWRAALAERPDFVAARQGLAQLYQQQGR
jgi:glycosyltransferase involved in cell wall biosynthesis/Tfp pilus assembly protein PilF